jgi:predicted ATP-binding protein involved in virulence
VEKRAKRHVARVSDHYNIHDTKAQIITPLGSIAKLIMEGVLAQKNKTSAQVPHWQETVNRIQEAGNKKKRLQKKIDEESEESLDQMAFRGIRNQVAGKDDGMDVSSGFSLFDKVGFRSTQSSKTTPS